MRFLRSALLSAALLAGLSAQAVELRTTLTKTSILELEVKDIIDRSFDKNFDKVFPPSQYAVYVIIDIQKDEAGQESSYISMGLSRRTKDGEVLLPHGTVSSILRLQAPLKDGDRRAITLKAFEPLCRTFSQVLVANAKRMK